MDNISIIIRNKDEAEFIGFTIQSCLDFFNKPEIRDVPDLCIPRTTMIFFSNLTKFIPSLYKI